jgi:prophage maintenance system killer protein
MRAEFNTAVFGKLKDGGFDSAIHQIRQSFSLEELYPSLEEKAAMLLYLVVKNHAFYTILLAKQSSATKRLHL